MRVRPLYVVIAICLTVDIARCNLRVFPQNAAVIAGQVMAMECRTQGGSVIREWSLLRASREEYHKSQQGSRGDIIFSNWGNLTSHTAEVWVDVDRYGSGTLYSNSTTLEVAGLYACAVETGHELTRWSAHLIVFESIPFCDTNLNTITGDSLNDDTRIWMRCTFKFRGYWTPSMEWRRHGEDNQNGQIVTADKVEESENFHVISTIIIIFNSSINGSFFSCKIYFSTHKPRLHANASNTPDFNYVWKSPTVKQLGYDSAFIAKPKTTHGYNDPETYTNHTYYVLLGLLITTSVFVILMIAILLLRLLKTDKTSGAVGFSTTPSALTLGETETSTPGKRLESTWSTSSQPDEDLPMYAVVRKNRKPPSEGTIGIACKIISSNTVEDKSQISDSESAYAEIGEIDGLKPKKEMRPPASYTMNCQSTYASIDHTENTPMP